MNFAPTEEQALLLDSIKRFVQREYKDGMRPASAMGPETDRWRTFADLGWLGLVAGLDGTSLAESVQPTTILAGELGAGLAPEPLLQYAILSAIVLRELSDSPLAQLRLRELSAGNWLPLLACGGAQCAPEITVTAEGFGSRYRLNGVVRRLLGASSAHSFLVPARLQTEVLFELLPKTAGVTRRDFRTVDGRSMSDLVLCDALVTPDQLISDSAELSAVLTRGWNHATLATCAEMVGVMSRALDATRSYLRVRRQFGRPIAEFQALQHQVAEMFVELEQARSMLVRGSTALQEPTFRGTLRQIHAMKVRVNEAAKKVGAQAIQLHGGIGMTEEYIVGRCYKRLLVDGKLFGDTRACLARFISE